MNATLKDTLYALQAEYKRKWVQVLQAATFAYNTSKSEATGYTPFFTLFGREAVTPGDILAESVEHGESSTAETSVPMYVEWTLGNLEVCHNFCSITPPIQT